MDQLMRFFDGFDKKELLLGTSGFYAAALGLILMSILLNQNLSLKKNNDFHKLNNLKSFPFFAALQSEKVTSHKTLLGFSSTVVLGNETSLSMVANQLELIMQNSEFEHIYYTLNCSKADCIVVFSAKEYEKNGLTKLANEQFINIWK
jgi:hypothetical protein